MEWKKRCIIPAFSQHQKIDRKDQSGTLSEAHSVSKAARRLIEQNALRSFRGLLGFVPFFQPSGLGNRRRPRCLQQQPSSRTEALPKLNHPQSRPSKRERDHIASLKESISNGQ
ncbi:hypothetical protein E4U14_006312 [Claviceps sp. LM454 group G7]|nr:hypothetical protein E4U14_006312 [Claviceps sp. LM454 group G7]